MWQLQCNSCDQLITNIMKALRCNSHCNRWYHSSCIYGIENETYWCVSKEHWICDACKAISHSGQMNNFKHMETCTEDKNAAEVSSHENSELIAPFSTVMQLFNGTKSNAFEEELSCVKMKMKTEFSNCNENFDGTSNAFSVGTMRFGFYIDKATASPVNNSISSFNFPHVQNNYEMSVIANDPLLYFSPPEKKFKYE